MVRRIRISSVAKRTLVGDVVIVVVAASIRFLILRSVYPLFI